MSKNLINEIHSLMEKIDKSFVLTEANDLLLEAMSVDDVYTKYYSNVNREDFDQIVKADPTTPENGSKTGKFVKWLLSLYTSNNLKLEDLYKANEYLKLYTKYFNKLSPEFKDINKIKTINDLYDVIKEFNNVNDLINNRGELKKGVGEKLRANIEVFYEDSQWKVSLPRTKEEAIAIGRDTQWCTSYDGESNMFGEYYSEDNPLYVIENKNSGNKYQFHFSTFQYMDSEDRPINPALLNLPIELITKFSYATRGGEVSIFTNSEGVSNIFFDTENNFYAEYITDNNLSVQIFLNDNFDEASVNDDDDFVFIPTLGLSVKFLKMMALDNNLDLKYYNEEVALYTFRNDKDLLIIQPLTTNTLFTKYGSVYYVYDETRGMIFDSNENEVEPETLNVTIESLDSIIKRDNSIEKQRLEVLYQLKKEGNPNIINSTGLRLNTKKEKDLISKYYQEYKDLFGAPNIRSFYNKLYWLQEKLVNKY